jgi:hypothetical protein
MRDVLAGILQGYTPVMIEHLLDEALVSAVRRGDSAMTWRDVEQARLVEEVGTGQPVGYTPHEKRLIATHEAGHATMAWLTAPERRLEVLTIIKRRSALGLLAHGDREEVYTRSRKELTALVQIALGGQCAEEIFFGDVSTGPGGDLLYATNTAAEMVGAHGMDGSLVSYLAVQNSSFSDTNIVGRVLADDRGRDAVEALLQRNKVAAKALMEQNSTSSRRCATPCSSARSWSDRRSPTCSRRQRLPARARRRPHRAGPGGARPLSLRRRAAAESTRTSDRVRRCSAGGGRGRVPGSTRSAAGGRPPRAQRVRGGVVVHVAR